MLVPDSLVTDLMFSAQAQVDQQALRTSLGGEDNLAAHKVLDPDMLPDPRMEMELSPSRPFRRRGERRLLLIDDRIAPMRENAEVDPIVRIDLRPYRDTLIAACAALPVRLGRLFALGMWGDAVVVARSARDLRAICLLPWVLDPQVDVDGKLRAGRLAPQEIEAKIMAYDKRLDELDDAEIMASLTGFNVEQRDGLIIVDVLDAEGFWDPNRSMQLEAQLAAIDRFSMLPGAPAQKRVIAEAPAAPPPAAAPVAAPAPEPVGPPLAVADLAGRVLLIFPDGRFDLDVAAALGKRDWSAVLRRTDPLPGATRDQIFRDGADWVAPLEFLSEVFVDGKPLSRPAFDQGARALTAGVRAFDVHFPRFGPVTLIDIAGKGRFVTSASSGVERIVEFV